MRNLYEVAAHREMTPIGAGSDQAGVFALFSPLDEGTLRIAASTDGGWDHVSISRGNRKPNLPEIEHVVSLFFEPIETVMIVFGPFIQIHDKNTVHIWRSQNEDIPIPPMPRKEVADTANKPAIPSTSND